ncbi:MAG: adenosine deaminase [Planctomycetes bacterium]|nr:adenosine deaminase [Planctomycetota bacterium]
MRPGPAPRPPAVAGDALRERLRRLPKTELHLHALGALRPATTVELARRAGSPVLAAAERAAAEGYAFDDLPHFVEFFIGLFGLVTTPADFERVAWEVAEDLAALGVRYAEVRWTPTSHTARGATVDGMWAGLEAARAQVERRLPLTLRWVVDFPRSLPLAVGEAACGIAVATRDRGTVAFDVAGDERAVGAEPRFAALFRRARAAGLGCLAHAGEAAGPESVAAALDLWGVDRIGHGTRAIEDAALVARLARGTVPLEVCPTSNEALGVVPSVAAHPVVELLRRGVPVVVSSDDPTLFGTDVVREHERLHLEAGVPLDTLGRLAAASFLQASLPAAERHERFADVAREAVAWSEAACA